MSATANIFALNAYTNCYPTVLEYVSAGFAIAPIPLGKTGLTNASWKHEVNCVKPIEQCNRITGNVSPVHAYTLSFQCAQDSIDITPFVSACGAGMPLIAKGA